jgi:tRNA G18 (ribose-2'-O)-methylase SpoU
MVTVAMALRNDSLDLRDRRLAEAARLAVVLGTEGDGLRDSTIAACDFTVRIPMAHQVDSLNVAAAAAIAFWELAR